MESANVCVRAAQQPGSPSAIRVVLQEQDIRSEERCRERARIVHELHDTLLQGFLGASMLLDQAVEQTPADSPCKPALSRALRLVYQAIDEGRTALHGLHVAATVATSLEEAFSDLWDEVAPGAGIQLRMFVQGKPRALKPAIQEQIFLIGREAVVNALRHSEATNIEVEVQYLRRLLRVFVRDNGRGIDPQVVQTGRDSHWGLGGMRERAESIGARFGITSRPGAGTEVQVAVEVEGYRGTERRNFKRQLSQGEDWPAGEGRSDSDNDGLCQLARGHTRARKFNASATATEYRRCRSSIAHGHYAEKASLR